MRVLFTNQPGSGMFNPLVPFARALQEAGHAVTFACADSFQPDVAAAGFASVPAGIDWRTDALSRTFPDAPPLGPQRAVYAGHLFRSISPRAMIPDLLTHAARWKPDLVVNGAAEPAGQVAAELLDLPHAVAGAIWFRPKREIVPSLDPLRHEFGLAPDPAGTRLYRYLALAPMPPSWVAQDEELPPTAHFIRPEPLDRPDAEAALSWFATLPPERPLVHATLGTTEVTQTPGLYEAILAGLVGEPANLVLGVGSHRDPAEFGPQPPHVRIVRYVPHGAFLPRCDLVLTHGGFGTITGCLAAGVPMVVIPVQGDQLRNARRCADLGVGRVVGPDERTPEVIRAAVRAVLAEPSYRRNAGELQDDLAALPGMEHAVALLEQLAAERRPLIATPTVSSATP
jgi:UDP:flavonoid glycosyltransferase YjiC (YdhE family)